MRKLWLRIFIIYTKAPLQVCMIRIFGKFQISRMSEQNCDCMTLSRMCGKVFCTYCAGDKWPIPKLVHLLLSMKVCCSACSSFSRAQEYIKPVRVCIKCKKLCWKAEAIVAAINANDVAAMQVSCLQLLVLCL